MALAVLGFGGLLAGARPAAAVSLINGATLAVNGLNITVSDCVLTTPSLGSSVSCGLYAMEMVADASPGASVRFQGSGGSDLFSTALGASSQLYDVTFTLNISAISPGTVVNQANLTLVGASSGSFNSPFNLLSPGSVISVGENTPGGNMNINLAGGVTSNSTFNTFTAVSSLSVTKDIKLNALPGNGSLTLSYVTQSYLPAPEPASIGLFLLGLGGLAAARRRFASTRVGPRH